LLRNITQEGKREEREIVEMKEKIKIYTILDSKKEYFE
jgi:hypothetical protein